MKKIFLSILLVAGLAMVSNAQGAATSTPGNVDQKPKTAVEQSKNELNPSDTAKQQASTSTSTEKKCAKKSCCKKDAESGSESSAGCSKDKHDGNGSCCKKKAAATATPKKND